MVRPLPAALVRFVGAGRVVRSEPGTQPGGIEVRAITNQSRRKLSTEQQVDWSDQRSLCPCSVNLPCGDRRTSGQRLADAHRLERILSATDLGFGQRLPSLS